MIITLKVVAVKEIIDVIIIYVPQVESNEDTRRLR